MELLQMSNISKSFFGVEVLHKVHFSVSKGTVHALLGENGAGKSTLMNILAGIYTKDSGTIVFDGETYDNMTVKKSEAAGIAFVHQELNLFNDLKVYENIFLNKEYQSKVFRKINTKKMIKETQALFDDLGVVINANSEVGSLTTGEKQLLEIARALHQNAKLIILDEPTTSLANEEIDNLFRIVNNLKKEGKSFIFISHKMPEIFRLADDYTVFRNGSFISSGKIKDTTPDALTSDIVGSAYSDGDIYEKRELGNVILDVKNLYGKGFNDVSIQVKKGEIIGFTGLQGAGSSEFLQTIFGVMPAEKGTIQVKGRYLKEGRILHTMKNDVAMVASNRKENSIVPEMSLLENMMIAEHQLSSGRPVIHYKNERVKFDRYKAELGVKCNSRDDLITSLSGGNQQKVILARWLNTDSDILILDNPTQGIDVGAKAEIYKLIMKLSKEGKTILFNTLEINEIKKVADRCIIFYHGHVEKILNHDEITEERVMLYATNAHKVVRESKKEEALNG